MLTKLLIRYLVLIGVITHLVVLAAFIAIPDLGTRLYLLAQRSIVAPPAIVNALAAQDRPPPNPRYAAWRDASGLPRWLPDDTAPLAAGEIRVDGVDMPNLRKAVSRLRDGSVLELGPGVYTSGVAIRPSNVQVVGRGHVIFDNAAYGGKATFVLPGDNTTIRNIECRRVSVADGNGACVRLAGRGLTLEQVYFHDAEQGILTGKQPGRVVIRDSYFENLGSRGSAHAIYHGLGGVLSIERSFILGARNQGHEVKSRALETDIRHSVIASFGSDDSRLIDISNGGTLQVTDSVLQQGPGSANMDMIGFALERNPHRGHQLTLRDNLIILERTGENRLLHSRADHLRADIGGNTIITAQGTGLGGDNREFGSREQAGVAPYPHVPARPLAR